MKNLWAFLAVLIVPLVAQMELTKITIPMQDLLPAERQFMPDLLKEVKRQAVNNTRQINHLARIKRVTSALIDKNYVKNSHFSPRLPKIGKISSYKNGKIPYWRNIFMNSITLSTWRVISPFKDKNWVCLFDPMIPAYITQIVKLKHRNRLVVGFELYLTHDLKVALTLEVLINNKVLETIIIKHKTPYRVQVQSNYFRVVKSKLTLGFRVISQGYEPTNAYKYLAISNVYLGQDMLKISHKFESLMKKKYQIDERLQMLGLKPKGTQSPEFQLQSLNATLIRSMKKQPEVGSAGDQGHLPTVQERPQDQPHFSHTVVLNQSQDQPIFSHTVQERSQDKPHFPHTVQERPQDKPHFSHTVQDQPHFPHTDKPQSNTQVIDGPKPRRLPRVPRQFKNV